MTRSQLMQKVQAVIFDMDGLMFDTEKIYYQAGQETADTLGMPYSFTVYQKMIGAGDLEYQTMMQKMYQDHELLEHFFEMSAHKLEELLLNGPVEKKPGLLEVLAYLKEQNIPMVVASSTQREMVEQLLTRLKVRKYFKAVVGGDEVPAAKPAPDIFQKAFYKTEVAHKEKVLILEDSKNGIRAAARAEIPVILIPDLVAPDAEMKEKAVTILPDLHHVIDFIENKK